MAPKKDKAPKDPNAPKKPRGPAKPRKSLYAQKQEELAKLAPKLAKKRAAVAKAQSEFDDLELEAESIQEFVTRYEARHPQPVEPVNEFAGLA
jgi:uncharacterized protein involved in exopolysaccharide biosynthesis